jgi:hypothetical protein
MFPNIKNAAETELQLRLLYKGCLVVWGIIVFWSL